VGRKRSLDILHDLRRQWLGAVTVPGGDLSRAID
jgi:hypothetical protein